MRRSLLFGVLVALLIPVSWATLVQAEGDARCLTAEEQHDFLSGDRSHYLSLDVQLSLGHAECVERMGSQFRVPALNGSSITVSLVGSRLYQVLEVWKGIQPLPTGLVTEPAHPEVVRALVRVHTVMGGVEEIEVWHALSPVKIVKFYDGERRLVITYPQAQHVQWALRIGKVGLFFYETPSEKGGAKIFTVPTMPGARMITFGLRWWLIGADFATDLSWQHEH